ncbi:hypothetical protein TSAR_003474 [Trichomalopsis sarcophagae]|uniref:Uncharacterized protein n=1 Tax=Trichomalopsis sarcophagae TaxID=543379 RepID=A0A232EQX1_9HYME|nr:hypothetical protein TSAR_003474 [Trichomalopsis sarcophagae]
MTLKKLQDLVVGTIFARKYVKYFGLDQIDRLLFILAEVRRSEGKRIFFSRIPSTAAIQFASAQRQYQKL